MSSATAEARPAQPEGKKRAALSRNLSELLVELSIAAHRFAMYPSDHPSLEPAAENVIRGLTRILQDRKHLALGVARRQLVIEGIATDEAHPVLSDLARRLHSHHLALVRFERGVTLQELIEFLRTLSEEPERGGQAVGLLPPEHLPTWRRIRVLPIGYDELELTDQEREEEEPPRVRQLWIGLARAAMKRDELPDEEPGGRVLARVIERKGGDEAYDKVIVGYLHQLAEELGGAAGVEAERARHMMSELVDALGEGTLTRLLQLGGAYPQRKRFLLDVNQAGITAHSVVQILESAAAVEGQNISTSLTRLLSKLSIHAGGRNRNLRAEAESAIRETVEKLISDWDLEDPNPDAYTQLLDRMSQASPMLEDAVGVEGLPGADRIVRMSLELDTGGPTLQKAVSQLLDEGRVGELFGLLDEAPEGSTVAGELLSQLTSPTQLQRLLAGEGVHDDSLKALVERIGSKAVDPLFQFLTESESRAVRRRAFDCLAALEVDVCEKVIHHLKDDRWFVQRNMLALLQEMEGLPPGFSPREYLKHDDPRVRREALALSLRNGAGRDQALSQAFRDEDERIVRIALVDVQDGLPDTLVPLVVTRVLESRSFPQLRSLAAQALGANRSSLAREALLNLCSRRGLVFFWKRRLASRSPETLAALSALATHWQGDPRVADVLERARRSRDPKIRAAVSVNDSSNED